MNGGDGRNVMPLDVATDDGLGQSWRHARVQPSRGGDDHVDQRPSVLLSVLGGERFDRHLGAEPSMARNGRAYQHRGVRPLVAREDLVRPRQDIRCVRSI